METNDYANSYDEVECDVCEGTGKVDEDTNYEQNERLEKKQLQEMANEFTPEELVRMCDLTIRRIVDYGIDEYGTKDKALFRKAQEFKKRYARKYGDML